jgi:hypothetical protein
MPTKYVKLELLTAASSSPLRNLEELLSLTGSKSKGIYLPPKLLPDHQSSLVFIPAEEKESLPKRKEILEAMNSRVSAGLILTPPGFALSKLLEKEAGKSFVEMDLRRLQKSLPKLLDELEITKKANVTVEDNTVTVEAQNHIFKDLCMETTKLERTRRAVGSPFSSALGCALAKAAGKPVTIENEQQSQDGKTMTVQYRLLEE